MTEMERYGNSLHKSSVHVSAVHMSAVHMSAVDDLRVGNEVIDLNQHSPNKQVTPRIVNAVSSFKEYSSQTQKLEELKNARKDSAALQPCKEDREAPRLSAGRQPDPSVETGTKSLEVLNVARLAENSLDQE